MTMTNEEIVRSYKQAKAQKAQIGILADLNACKREEIIRVLMESGIPEKELRRSDWKPKAKKESPDKEAPKEAVADDASEDETEDEESTVVTELKERKWKLELKRADLDMQIDAPDVVIGMMEEEKE